MQQPPKIPPQRLPMIAGTGIVIVGLVIAALIVVNNVSPPVDLSTAASPSASAVPSVTPVPSATPTPVPSASQLAYADCGAASFGPALRPLNQPADVHRYSAAPAMTIDQSKLYEATITTPKGKIVLCLQPELAPVTVNNFVTLARNHFYDGIPFHRVVSGFVIQGGDPNCIGNVPAAPATPTGSCGQGGPGYQFNDEPVRQQYVQGCVAMANSGPNTNGSQFFICTADDTKQLAPSYNLFGKVQSGLNVALKIVQGDKITSITVAEQK